MASWECFFILVILSSFSVGSSLLLGEWSCDSSIATTCPTACIVVDAQSGCLYCKSNCHSTSHAGQQTQPAGSHGSGTGQTSGSSDLSVWSSPWSCDLTVTVSCPSECIVMEQKTRCMTCMKGCLQSVMPQHPGGPSPTDAPASSHVQFRTTHVPSVECPFFPPNCPQSFAKIENSCLVCTILQQATAHPVVSDKPIVMTTTTAAPTTCAPVRCLAPCNVGIVIISNGCLACKCPDHV